MEPLITEENEVEEEVIVSEEDDENENQLDEAEFNALFQYYKDRTENENKSTRLYIIFCVLRVLLTIAPQSGYIHPDEYMQSLEVVGGRILNADVDPPWEFNRTNPVRSITVPYLVNGIPLLCLRIIAPAFEYLLNINIITPYTILLSTRLTICLASFLIDLSLYKICKIYSRPYHAKLTILSSSYVMLIFGTRTFSNTIEMILFSVLLWVISRCMYDHDLLVRFRKQFIKMARGLPTPRHRVKHLKIIKLIESHNLQDCFLISCLSVLGCFNRPTFVLFGIGPIFFWIHRGLSSEFFSVKDIHVRMFMFLISALPLILLGIIVDSSYFGYLTGPELLSLEISLSNFVFPPWNFLKYNLNPKNLEIHGLHPKWVHALINMPLLFGVLTLVMWRSLINAALKLIKTKIIINGYMRALEIDNLMRVALVVPIAMHSLIPHQEPRFIIPVILPLIFLYGDKLYNTVSKPPFENNLFRLWCGFNLIMTCYYGFLQQGGVYHLSTHLHHQLENTPKHVQFHLVTSHMYSYPRILLVQPDTNQLYKSDGIVYQRKARVRYYEQQSKSVQELSRIVKLIYRSNSGGDLPAFNIIIALPALLSNELERNVPNLKFVASLYPHFSAEAITKPEFWDLGDLSSIYLRLIAGFSRLQNVLSLNIYSISYINTTSS